MRGLRVAVGLGLVCVSVNRAAAQSDGNKIASLAVIQTPIGALPPIATTSIESELQRHVLVSIRYGYLTGQQNDEKHNFGLTAVVPLTFGATISFTGGLASCIECGTGFMLGAGADWRFWEMPVGVDGDGQRLTLGLNGDAGFGQMKARNIEEGNAWSWSLGLPVGLVRHSNDAHSWRFVPFMTPGFSYGLLQRNGFNTDGTTFTLGGGVGIFNRSNSIAVNIGARYITVGAGDILAGLGVVLGKR